MLRASPCWWCSCAVVRPWKINFELFFGINRKTYFFQIDNVFNVNGQRLILIAQRVILALFLLLLPLFSHLLRLLQFEYFSAFAHFTLHARYCLDWARVRVDAIRLSIQAQRLVIVWRHQCFSFSVDILSKEKVENIFLELIGIFWNSGNRTRNTSTGSFIPLFEAFSLVEYLRICH